MAINSSTISRLYDFQPGKKAYSGQVDDEFNQLVETVNNIVTDLLGLDSDKATVIALENLAGEDRTTETVKQNSDNLKTHKTSSDHDSRYYTELEIDTKLSTINTNHTNLYNAFINHRTSADHDGRYYTKEQLQQYLRGGDTNRKEEVFTIVNPDNGDGTFTCTDIYGNSMINPLTEEGHQVFYLKEGYYQTGLNRIEVIINDTLRRSPKSGGIVEISDTSFELTSPEEAGAEITVVYYERLGMAAEYNIKMGTVKPPQNDGKTMWFEVIE